TPEGTPVVWVSFCSSLAALQNEYRAQAQGCVLREVVDLRTGEDLDEWTTRVMANSVRMWIGAEPKPIDPFDRFEVKDDEWRVIRFRFDAGVLTERFESLKVETEFEGDPEQRRFPIKFSSYYLVGRTELTFAVHDPTALVDCDDFLASPIGS